MQPGMLVDYRDYPPLGTRVMSNHDNKPSYYKYPPQCGVIIANNEDNGTEIGVRWDNGHSLWCGKKGSHRLKYC